MTARQISEILERIETMLAELSQAGAKPYDLTAAAEYLGISRSHLYQLTSKNLIPFYKPAGKLIYFDRADLDAYLKRNRMPARYELEESAAQA